MPQTADRSPPHPPTSTDPRAGPCRARHPAATRAWIRQLARRLRSPPPPAAVRGRGPASRSCARPAHVRKGLQTWGIQGCSQRSEAMSGANAGATIRNRAQTLRSVSPSPRMPPVRTPTTDALGKPMDDGREQTRGRAALPGSGAIAIADWRGCWQRVGMAALDLAQGGLGPGDRALHRRGGRQTFKSRDARRARAAARHRNTDAMDASTERNNSH